MRQQPANADAQADLLGCGAARWWAQLLPARGAWGAVEGARSGCLMRAAPLLVRPLLLGGACPRRDDAGKLEGGLPLDATAALPSGLHLLLHSCCLTGPIGSCVALCQSLQGSLPNEACLSEAHERWIAPKVAQGRACC